MNSNSPSFVPFPGIARLGSLFLVMALFTAPLCAQQTKPSVAREAETKPAPTFDTLLSADSYVVYGEVRNLGQLLSTGGAGEIVDPILKLADPGKEFKSIVSFLKKNSEMLTSSRLLFATWPARSDVPDVLVAIEFPTNDEANKFAPTLAKFLPTVLPPVPDASPSPVSAQPGAAKAMPAASPLGSGSPSPPAEHLPFVITHAGNLVLISDKAFKFEKLHPAASKPLIQDQNFR